MPAPYGSTHNKRRSRLGDKLRAWRTRREITQAQAATLCGADQSTWSDWERGAASPERLENLLLIELHVGIPIESWLGSARARRVARTVFSARLARAKSTKADTIIKDAVVTP